MLQSEYWRRLEEVLQGALEVPDGQRHAWLKRACAGDEALRSEVQHLLDRGDGESPVIAGIVEDAAAGLFDEDGTPSAMAGMELGNYRIVRELGRGGMGAVYLAVRADQTFDKQVAVKLVKRGIDTDAVLRRFWYERRIVAALEHPYIARLLDGGTSPDGRPYFVMEFVDGTPLDVYARAHNLSNGQCCDLVAKVCEAVSHAHRNLIVHRDLKPANVLVSADGTPKLLDFGIARLLSAEPGEQTVTGPQAARALTPDFASPEQVRGEAVTTATDVYSLGKMLAAVLPAGRELPADLSTIIGKATREEIDQRYASVADFREDLRRYLAGLPILACDQTVLYQAGKFVRRHRMGVGVFVLANLLGMAGIAAVLWEAHRAQIERQRAEQRLSRAVDMAERTLATVNNSIANLPGTTEVRRQMARNTLDNLDRLAKDSGGDARVLTALAKAYVQVAEVLGNADTPNLGDLPGSLAAYRKALGLIPGLLEKNRDDFKVRDVASAAHQGAGRVLQTMGRQKEAEAEDRAAIALADSTLARNSDRAESQERSLEAHFALDSFLSPDRSPETEQDAKKQLPLAIRLAEAHPDDLAKQDLVSEYYSMIGVSVAYQNRLQESLVYFRKAAEIRETIHRSAPHDTRFQRNLMMVYGHIGDVFGSPYFANSLRDYQGALEYYTKAERIAEEMSRADPSDTRAAFDLGMVWTRIGGAQQAAGNLKSSNSSFDRAIAIFEPLWKSTPGSAAYRGGILLAYTNRGRNMGDLGDPASSMMWYRKALAIADKLITEGRTDLSTRLIRVTCLQQIANLLAVSGDREGALKMAGAAIAEAQERLSHGGAQATLAQSWFYYARTYETLHDCQTATAAYRKAVELWTTPGVVFGTPDLLHEAQRKAAHCGSD